MKSKSWKLDQNKIFVNKNLNEVHYPKDGNATFFKIEEKSPWFHQRNDLIKTLIIKNKFCGNFLDIGGGNGFQIKALEKLKDIDQTYLVEPGYTGCLNAKKRGIKNVYCGLFQEFDFKKNNIKLCGLFDVVEHIEDDITFLNELYDKTEKNTHLIINVPALKFLWSDVDTYSGHFRRYNKKDIKRILQKTNFKLVDSGYYFSFYVLPLLALRVLPYRLGIKRSASTLKKKEIKNHSRNNILQAIINKQHEKRIKKIYKNRYPILGTSMFLILKR